MLSCLQQRLLFFSERMLFCRTLNYINATIFMQRTKYLLFPLVTIFPQVGGIFEHLIPVIPGHGHFWSKSFSGITDQMAIIPIIYKNRWTQSHDSPIYPNICEILLANLIVFSLSSKFLKQNF